MIKKLPDGEKVIGLRTILKGIENGTIKTAVIASNCPDFIKEKIKTKIEIFDGDESKLGTSIGKPFPVAVIGIKSDENESDVRNQ